MNINQKDYMEKRLNKYYVYEHLDLEDKRFYIGRGSNYRCKAGVSGRSKRWHDKTPNGFKYNILMDNLTKAESIELEGFLIKEIGYDNLVNYPQGHNALGNKSGSIAFEYDGINYNSIKEYALKNNIKYTTAWARLRNYLRN